MMHIGHNLLSLGKRLAGFDLIYRMFPDGEQQGVMYEDIHTEIPNADDVLLH